MIPSKCTDVNFERWIEDTEIVIGGLCRVFNLLDPNDVPQPAVHNAAQIGAMTSAQREANKVLLDREEDYTSGMKRATTGVALSARNNLRAKNRLLQQRRQLNLAAGVNPIVTEQLQALRNAFNPVSTTNASAKLLKIQKYKLRVGQSLTTFIYWFSAQLEDLEYLRTTPVLIAERRQLLTEALENGERSWTTS